MHFSNMSKFERGWIVGDFSPSLITPRDKGLEFAVKQYKKGQFEGFYYNETQTTIYIIIDGKVKVNDKIYSKDDVIIFDKGEEINFLPLEDTDCILLRKGEEKAKKILTADVEIDELLSTYKFVMKQIGSNECENNISDICDEEITVLVQGGIDKVNTKLCLKSIRLVLPKAKILLSTWEGSDISGLEFDEIITNKDPGNVEIECSGTTLTHNNINRQLISTKEGLSKVHTKYTLKLRSDLILTTSNFLNYFGKYENKNKGYKVFSSRIIVPELFSRESLTYLNRKTGEKETIKTPFHISDWFLFGYTQDIKEYFNSISLMDKEQMSSYNFRFPERLRGYYWKWQFPPEQYFAYSAYIKHFSDVRMRDLTDYNDETIKISEKFVFDNFMPLSTVQHGIINRKYQNDCIFNNGIFYNEVGIIRYTDFLKYLQ